MIHVLTLNWNGKDKLERLAPGLLANLEQTGEEYCWYIRDNGSKDGSVQFIEELIKSGKKVKALFVDHNRNNFAQGVNSLAKMALNDRCKVNITNESFISFKDLVPKFDTLLFMNNDIEFPEENSLTEMVNLYKTSNSAMVGCRLLYNGTDKLQHAGVIFSPKYGNMPYHYRHQETTSEETESNKFFQAVTAAVCLVNFSAFLEVDGMDERFHWAFEDIDLCLKIKDLGHKISYCGKTKIFHEESASLKKNPVNKMFMGPNVDLFKKKWFGKYKLDHDDYLKNPKHLNV